MGGKGESNKVLLTLWFSSSPKVKPASEGSWLRVGITNNLLPFWGGNSSKTISSICGI